MIDSFTYYRHDYTQAETSDVPARRAELLALLGQPTHWEKWTRPPGGTIDDRFDYVPDRLAIGHLQDAWRCTVDWECTSLREEKDCRPLVRQVNFPVVSGGFGSRFLDISVTDYALKSAALLRNDRFLRRDLSGVICPIPRVH